MYVNAADFMQIQYGFRSRMEIFHPLRDGRSGLGPNGLDHDILRNCRCSETVFRKLAIRRNIKTYTNHGQSWQWWCDRMLTGWHKQKIAMQALRYENCVCPELKDVKGGE